MEASRVVNSSSINDYVKVDITRSLAESKSKLISLWQSCSIVEVLIRIDKRASLSSLEMNSWLWIFYLQPCQSERVLLPRVELKHFYWLSAGVNIRGVNFPQHKIGVGTISRAVSERRGALLCTLLQALQKSFSHRQRGHIAQKRKSQRERKRKFLEFRMKFLFKNFHLNQLLSTHEVSTRFYFFRIFQAHPLLTESHCCLVCVQTNNRLNFPILRKISHPNTWLLDFSSVLSVCLSSLSRPEGCEIASRCRWRGKKARESPQKNIPSCCERREKLT